MTPVRSRAPGARFLLSLSLVAAAAVPLATTPSPVAAQARNGTTLAATKTLDICLQPNGLWRYSGVISLWNQGRVDTQGLAINDCIQNKTDGFQFTDQYCTSTFFPDLIEIPAGTTQPTALDFSYFFHEPSLPGDVRNIARVTILNHSGFLGVPKGPEPKATWVGAVPECDRTAGCTDPVSWWANPATTWPSTQDRTFPFYNSGQSWGQAITSTSLNAYWILAREYAAAVLNIDGHGSAVPAGLQIVLNRSNNFFAVNSTAEATCPGLLSCGEQRTWAQILKRYNTGDYPAGPPACVH